ncbi:unnamed protein product [Penicillium bialowiezense]
MSAMQPFHILTSQQRSAISFISPVLTEAGDSDSSLTHEKNPASLETIYGLRLTLSKSETDEKSKYRVSLTKPVSHEGPEDSNTPEEIQGVGTQIQASGNNDRSIEPSNLQPKKLRPYSLFPDYGQSFLWRDDWDEDESEDDYEVEDEDIDSRYPSFYPSFERWKEVYFKAFEEQECHLGSHKPVFTDVRVHVGWLVEGLLLGCWLALQEDVKSVSYHPGSIEYRLLKDPESNEGLQEFDSVGEVDEMDEVDSDEIYTYIPFLYMLD